MCLLRKKKKIPGLTEKTTSQGAWPRCAGGAEQDFCSEPRLLGRGGCAAVPRGVRRLLGEPGNLRGAHCRTGPQQGKSLGLGLAWAFCRLRKKRGELPPRGSSPPARTRKKTPAPTRFEQKYGEERGRKTPKPCSISAGEPHRNLGHAFSQRDALPERWGAAGGAAAEPPPPEPTRGDPRGGPRSAPGSPGPAAPERSPPGRAGGGTAGGRPRSSAPLLRPGLSATNPPARLPVKTHAGLNEPGAAIFQSVLKALNAELPAGEDRAGSPAACRDFARSRRETETKGEEQPRGADGLPGHRCGTEPGSCSVGAPRAAAGLCGGTKAPLSPTKTPLSSAENPV